MKIAFTEQLSKRIEKSFEWGLEISPQRVVDNESKDAVAKLKGLLHRVVENENKSFVTRLKFLLQRVVDSLIVGDDHGVTSHRAVILKTITIHHYPFHFQKKMKKNIQGLGNSMTTYCDCMSRELEYLEQSWNLGRCVEEVWMEEDRIARLELHKDIGVALASLRTSRIGSTSLGECRNMCWLQSLR